MKVFREDLINAYQYKFYDTFLELLDGYMEKGYGIDYDIVYRYMRILLKNREFEKVYEMNKWLEKTNKDPNILGDIFCFYLYTFKPKDAERVLKKANVKTINKSHIVRLYLLQGKVDKAKELVREYLKENPNDEILIFLNRTIINHEYYDAWIEMDYESFVENGHTLESGHMVYLKKAPYSANNIQEDDKGAYRPYLIWKLEGGRIYLFPVTTNLREGRYRLYSQKYPNSVGDRGVKDNLCYTTVDNILSVNDKIREEDFRPILKNIYNVLYFSRSQENKKNNEKFMQQYHAKVEENNVIIVVDFNTMERRYFFVIGVKKDCYEVVEVDNEYTVLSYKVELFSNSRLYFKKRTLTENDILSIRSQLPKKLVDRSIIGARIEINKKSYIVLCEKNDTCLCINEDYNTNGIDLKRVKKESILDTYGFIDNEEVESIKDMVSNKGKNNIKKLLRKFQ